MMKFTYVLVLIVLNSNITLAQQAFKLTLVLDPSNLSGYAMKPIQVSNGHNYFLSTKTGAAIVVKTDENGILFWSKYLQLSGLSTPGIIFSKYRNDILALATKSDTICLIKFDSSGNEEWVKRLRKPSSLNIKTFLVSDDMKIIIAGNHNIGSNPDHFGVYSCDSLGNFISGKEYFTTGAFAMEDLNMAADGGYIITGYKGSDQFVLRTNSQGNLIWNHFYSTNNASFFKLFDAIETSNGSIITTGRYYTSSTYARPYILKYDVAGNFTSLRYYLDEQKLDVNNSFLKFSNGNLCMVTSSAYGPGQQRRIYYYMDAGGNPTSEKLLQYYSHLSSAENCVTSDNNLLQTMYNGYGLYPTFEFIKLYDNYNLCPVVDPYPTSSSNLSNINTLSEAVTESLDFLINETSTLSPIIYTPPGLISYTCGNTSGVGLDENSPEPFHLSLVPNPATDFIKLFSADGTVYDLKFYNNNGSLVLNQKINNALPVKISHLSPGLYFYRLSNGNIDTDRGKIVKF